MTRETDILHEVAGFYVHRDKGGTVSRAAVETLPGPERCQ